MNFEYAFQPRATADIDIEDPFNCVIKGTTQSGKISILVIKTVLGETQIIEYGLIEENSANLLPSVRYLYTRIPFSEKTIIGKIKKFLNDSFYDIFQAEEVALEDVEDLFLNLIEKVS